MWDLQLRPRQTSPPHSGSLRASGLPLLTLGCFLPPRIARTSRHGRAGRDAQAVFCWFVHLLTPDHASLRHQRCGLLGSLTYSRSGVMSTSCPLHVLVTRVFRSLFGKSYKSAECRANCSETRLQEQVHLRTHPALLANCTRKREHKKGKLPDNCRREVF